MKYLFLDTTSVLKVGILDDSFNWIVYEQVQVSKPSEIIHSKIFHLLKDHKIDLKKSGLIYIAGPGSYTGMRLSEGIVETFKLNEISVYGLYHYQIPQYSGVNKGKWICDAFKSQYFVYEWDKEQSKNFLINKSEANLAESYFYSDDNLKVNGINIDTFLKSNSNSIFKSVVSNGLQPKPYYFRELEMEFSPSC